jgi:type I pantothenate kinase
VRIFRGHAPFRRAGARRRPPPPAAPDVPPPAPERAPAGGTPAVPTFTRFTRPQWAALRDSTPLLLTAGEIDALRGINEPTSAAEVGDVLLPLSRLVNLYATAARDLLQVTDRFIGRPSVTPPFVVAIAGQRGGREEHRGARAARGARALAGAPARGARDDRRLPAPERGARGPRADAAQGLPRELRRGAAAALPHGREGRRRRGDAPVYSHLVYDVVPGETLAVRRPDVLILEGINVLQPPPAHAAERGRLAVSDFVDFSIYVDADEATCGAGTSTRSCGCATRRSATRARTSAATRS